MTHRLRRDARPKIAREMLGLGDSVAEPTHAGDYRDALQPTLARTEMAEHGEPGGKQRDFPAGGDSEGTGRFRKGYKTAPSTMMTERKVKSDRSGG